MATKGSPLYRIKQTYRECMNLTDDDSYAIDAFVAVMTATFHPDCVEPSWLWIIGPPGSGKTETIRAMERYEQCVFISSLTENALLSGYSDEDGNDPSLVPLLDQKVLVIKDATALMSDPKRMMKNAGDLRDCFDGFCAKPSGKAGMRSYESSFGIIACITDEIDNFMEKYQQLGERFLSVRIHRASLHLKERVEYLHKVRATMKDKLKWQKHLKEITTSEIDNIQDLCLKQPMPNSDDVDHTILMVADVVALLRSTLVNGNASTPELSTRISQQILNLTMARAFADGRSELDEKDIGFARRIAIDTLPSARLALATLLYRTYPYLKENKTGFSVAGFQQRLTGVSTASIAAMLLQYHHVGLVQRIPVRKEAFVYRLHEDAYEYLQESGLLDSGKHMRPNQKLRDHTKKQLEDYDKKVKNEQNNLDKTSG